jgi:hypothetical protein
LPGNLKVLAENSSDQIFRTAEQDSSPGSFTSDVELLPSFDRRFFAKTFPHALKFSIGSSFQRDRSDTFSRQYRYLP